jgi:hypothetical protein
MIRERGIKSGLWMIWTRFNFAVTNIVGADGGPSGPGVISQLIEVGIQKSEPGPLAVDAAEVWAKAKAEPAAAGNEARK